MICFQYFLCLVLLAAAGAGCAQPQPKMMSAEEAETKARAVHEAQALYTLRGGVLAGCIDVKTERSCDSDWVTCREDAWVVKFTAGERCSVKHDGRLAVVLLIDGKTGDVISKFPEIEYFQDERFCRDDFDCLCSGEEKERRCLNFIHAQLDAGETAAGVQNGRCGKNVCEAP